jgi:hypothetical protein
MISSVEVAKRTIQTLEQEKGLLRQELVAHQDTSKSKVKEEEPEVVDESFSSASSTYLATSSEAAAGRYCRSERPGRIP